ncbi:ATP-grasp domain-containing protein [Streptomyces sp. NPDC049577]|uniref:ATP-grasp domain-containing protein n=1 Tax=Streptomyces sp. NPDC049577 TaxID=3155153 RepID=UPI00343CA33D
MPNTPADRPHILILAGAGGLPLAGALDSAATVTSRLSVVQVQAWGRVDVSAVRKAWQERFTGVWRNCPDLQEAYAAAREIHRTYPLDGIATFSELLIQPQADLAAEFGLPGNPPEAVRAAQNKLAQRVALRDAGVLDMRFAAIRTEADLAAAAESVGFPSVFKPAYGAASMSVRKVSSARELERAYRDAVAAADRSPFLVKEDLYLLEEVLVGSAWHTDERYADYVSVESLVQDGEVHHLGVVDKLAMRHGYVEEGHVYPSALDAGQCASVTAHAGAAIRALGLRTGAVHTEVKLTADGPRCIEVNARLGGPMGNMFRAASDHDIVASILRVAAGLPAPTGARPRGAVCVRTVPGPDRPMRIAHVADPAELRGRFGFLGNISMRFAAGTVVDPGKFPHLLSLLVTGEDADRAVANAATVEEALAIELEPVEKEHVLFVDRVGYDRYRLPDGSPALDPERHRVTLITRPEVVHQVRPGECAEVLALDIGDHGLRDALAAAVHGRRAFDRVLVFTEALLLPVAHLRERLGAAGPPVAAITPFRDKPAMKRVAERGGLEVADWAPVESAAEALPLLEKYGRIVLKPRDGAGSRGVHVVAHADELRALDAEPSVDLSGYQAEEFIDAPMLHIDVVVRRGAVHTCVVSRYLSSTLSHTTGRPLSSVTVDDPDVRARADELTRAVIEAFGVGNSVLHLEAFEREDGRLLFNEVACRAGGGGIIPVVQAVTGVNLSEAMVRLAMDEDPTTTFPRRGAAAGFFMRYGREGVIAEIDDAAIPAEWLVERRLAAVPGSRFTPVGLAGGALATYVVTGASEAEVRERLAFVEAETSVVYADEPGRGER